jgi:putative FmdB family regulatory protein
MAKYNFVCRECGHRKTTITSWSNKEIDCEKCSSKMIREMPNLAGQQVFETVDSFNNIKQERDQKEIS